MKTYDARKRRSKQMKNAVQNVLEFHKKYRNSYFWKPRGNASSRRNQEQQFEIKNPSFQILTEDGKITVEPSLRMSTKNVYYSLSIDLDGRSKDIRLLKKLIQ